MVRQNIERLKEIELAKPKTYPKPYPNPYPKPKPNPKPNSNAMSLNSMCAFSLSFLYSMSFKFLCFVRSPYGPSI